nr:ACT domain-containing protein [Maliibacterium massiliense]
MRAFVSVIGKDKKGIIASVTRVFVENDINILDISQTILQDYFTMVMLVELGDGSPSFDVMQQKLDACGQELGMVIRIQREDIFNAMHRI